MQESWDLVVYLGKVDHDKEGHKVDQEVGFPNSQHNNHHNRIHGRE